MILTIGHPDRWRLSVYGSDAVYRCGQLLFIHKLRGLDIGGSMETQTWAQYMKMGEWEAWLKSGTGADKTDSWSLGFWERTGGVSAATATFLSNGDFPRFWRFELASRSEPGRVGSFRQKRGEVPVEECRVAADCRKRHPVRSQKSGNDRRCSVL